MASLKVRKQNEHDAKQQLADSLNAMRKHCDNAINDLQGALELLQLVRWSMDKGFSIDADADSLDLGEIDSALREISDEGIADRRICTQNEVDRLVWSLSEATIELRYLQAGDFNE